MQTCEFCSELGGHPDNRFRQIYGDSIATRVVAETSRFVAIPTLGQIFPGSLLIVPRLHIETCAQLDLAAQRELWEFVRSVSSTLEQFGEPVFFEHGATECSGGSCGIYHAHLHVVPLPLRISPNSLFREHRASASDLLQALDQLTICNHYLLIGNQESVVYAAVNSLAERPQSQYFRRYLSERFCVNKPWNWRQTNSREPDLLATISAFRNTDIAQQKTPPA